LGLLRFAAEGLFGVEPNPEPQFLHQTMLAGVHLIGGQAQFLADFLHGTVFDHTSPTRTSSRTMVLVPFTVSLSGPPTSRAEN
jgi:hypothetical protein